VILVKNDLWISANLQGTNLTEEKPCPTRTDLGKPLRNTPATCGKSSISSARSSIDEAAFSERQRDHDHDYRRRSKRGPCHERTTLPRVCRDTLAMPHHCAPTRAHRVITTDDERTAPTTTVGSAQKTATPASSTSPSPRQGQATATRARTIRPSFHHPATGRRQRPQEAPTARRQRREHSVG